MTREDLQVWYAAHKADHETKLAMALRDAMTLAQRTAAVVAFTKRIAAGHGDQNTFELWIVSELHGVVTGHLAKLPGAFGDWHAALGGV